MTMITDITSIDNAPLTGECLEKLDAYWRAANYLSVGQLYLCDNPLLEEPLKIEHLKKMQLGHWGTTPGRILFILTLTGSLTDMI